jgi:hypothetical protein
VSTQFGGSAYQTHRIPSTITTSISKLQTIYITPIMIMQANISMGWPPMIPMNYKGYKTILVMNPKA